MRRLIILMVAMMVVGCEVSADIQPSTDEHAAQAAAISTATAPAETEDILQSFPGTLDPQHQIINMEHDSIRIRFGLGDFSSYVSPDQQHVALAGSTGVSLRDASTFDEIWYRPMASKVRRVVFSQDSSLLVSVELSGVIVLWDVQTGEELNRFYLEGSLTDRFIDVAVSPDNSLLAAGNDKPMTFVWNIATGETVHEFAGDSFWVRSLHFSPDGNYLFSNQGWHEGTSWLLGWRLSDEKQIIRLRSGYLSEFGFAPDGQTLLLGVTGRSIDLSLNLDEYIVPDYQTHYLSWGAWSPDAETYVCMSVICPDDPDFPTDGQEIAEVIDRQTRETLFLLEGSQRSNYTFSPDGEFILANGSDEEEQRTFMMWEAQTGDLVHSSPVDFRVGDQWLDDRRLLVNNTSPQFVGVWNIETLSFENVLARTDDVFRLAWSDDGQSLTGWWSNCGLCESTIPALRWHASSNQVEHLAPGPYPQQGDLAGSSWQATIDEKTTLLISNASTDVSFYLTGHRADITYLAWAEDGSRLASADEDQSVWVWDMTTRERQHVFNVRSGIIRDVSWSPDLNQIAIAAGDVISMWDVTTGEQIATFRMPPSESPYGRTVSAIGWSPDGAYIATGLSGGAIIIWDVAGGEQTYQEHIHSSTVLDIVWSPDGMYLATGSSDGSIIVWEDLP